MGSEHAIDLQAPGKACSENDLFLAANGFSVLDYSAPTFTIGILGLRLKHLERHVKVSGAVLPFVADCEAVLR